VSMNSSYSGTWKKVWWGKFSSSRRISKKNILEKSGGGGGREKAGKRDINWSLYK